MKNLPSSHIFGKRFCKRILSKTAYVSEEDVNPMLPFHCRLSEMLSVSALMYALRESPEGMYFTGLWLAYRVVHFDQVELTENALSLLFCATSKLPSLHDKDLESLIIALSSQVRDTSNVA